jgi:ATP-dependent DNA helicase RecQ
MQFDNQEALDLLRAGTGKSDVNFRAQQLDAIQSVIQDGSRTLVLQRTGWGKSFVYFIGTKMLRSRGEGVALLISPLLSLMRNQLDAARKMGVNAEVINSENPDEWEEIAKRIHLDAVDILIISPERLSNDEFINKVLTLISNRISLLIVDEAHCISDWGHDFRPDYRRIRSIINGLPQNFRLLATTATANERVQNDLEGILGPNLRIIKGELARKSLTLQTKVIPSQTERMAWLAQYIPQIPGSGVLYVLTVRDAEVIAGWLSHCGISASAYHGRLESDEKIDLEQKLLSNEIKVLVATSALGMGFDKPDIGFVIHYQVPGSVVTYYQQVGRAGRAVESAYGILLAGKEDLRIHSYFINSAFPSELEVKVVIEALNSQEGGVSKRELQKYVNLPEGRMEKILKILSLETPSPVLNFGSKWQATGIRDVPKEFWEKVSKLTELREQEVADMQEYLGLPFGQHMKFLIERLQGEDIQDNPNLLPELPSTISLNLVEKAKQYLKLSHRSIEPRLQWPRGAFQTYGFAGNIQSKELNEFGLCLTLQGEDDWFEIGRMKYQLGSFEESIVHSAADQLRLFVEVNQISWICPIPSKRHPLLVADFAKRLAHELRLDFTQALHAKDLHQSQKSLNNSYFQARNLDGAFEVEVQEVKSSNVLLVDDFVDSRWTVTVAGALLRQAGSGLVFPYALAKSTSGD